MSDYTGQELENRLIHLQDRLTELEVSADYLDRSISYGDLPGDDPRISAAQAKLKEVTALINEAMFSAPPPTPQEGE